MSEKYREFWVGAPDAQHFQILHPEYYGEIDPKNPMGAFKIVEKRALIDANAKLKERDEDLEKSRSETHTALNMVIAERAKVEIARKALEKFDKSWHKGECDCPMCFKDKALAAMDAKEGE